MHFAHNPKIRLLETVYAANATMGIAVNAIKCTTKEEGLYNTF